MWVEMFRQRNESSDCSGNERNNSVHSNRTRRHAPNLSHTGFANDENFKMEDFIGVGHALARIPLLKNETCFSAPSRSLFQFNSEYQ